MISQKKSTRTMRVAKLAVFTCLTVAVLLGSVETVRAQSSWTGAVSDFYLTAGNWSTSTEPNSGTDALFDSNSTANRTVVINGYNCKTLTFAESVPGQVILNGTHLAVYGGNITCNDTDYDHEVNVRLWCNNTDLTVDVVAGGILTLGGKVDAGTHALIKNGDGLLSLTGTNTYTGGTTINAGDISISGGAVLADTGAVNIASGARLRLYNNEETIGSLTGTGTVHLMTGHNLNVAGTIGPGNSIGTLNIIGDFTIVAGSTTEIEINEAGQTDLIAITGGATINSGATLKVMPLDTIETTQDYKFMTTTTGITGEYTILDTSLIDFTTEIRGNDYYFTVTVNPFTKVAQTQNQMQTGIYLERTSPNATGDYKTVLDQMRGLATDDEVRNSMEQVDGELFPTLSVATLQAASNFNRIIADQIRSGLGSGSNQFAASEITLGDMTVRAQNGCGCNRWNGWTAGYGLGGQAYGDGNAHGYHFGSGGLVLGIDRQLDSQTRLGLLYGNGFASTSLNGLAASSSINSHVFGMYLKRRYADWYSTTIADLGFDNYESRRRIAFGTIDRTATAKHNGWQSTVYQELGRTLNLGRGRALQPYGALQYIYVRQNGFTETGANSVNLQVAGEDINSLRSILGGRLITSRSLPWLGGGELAFRTHWVHELLNQTTGIVTTSLAGGGAPGFDVRGVDLGRDWVVLGPDAMWQYNDHVQLRAAYDLTVNANQAYHTGGGSVTFTW